MSKIVNSRRVNVLSYFRSCLFVSIAYTIAVIIPLALCIDIMNDLAV